MTAEEFSVILDDCRLKQRDDMAVFALLSDSVHTVNRVVTAAEHDKIYLAWSATDAAEKLSTGQARELGEAGVFVDEDTDSICMFV